MVNKSFEIPIVETKLITYEAYPSSLQRQNNCLTKWPTTNECTYQCTVLILIMNVSAPLIIFEPGTKRYEFRHFNSTICILI